MKWTTKKPTTLGWYWWRYSKRSGHGAVRVQIFGPNQQLWVDGDGLGSALIDEWPGQWSDTPIPEPEDAK